jgi:Cu+-exporting ATPase
MTKGATSMATATDPVCGMEVDAATAAGSSEYQGQTYYFCSAKDRDEFLTDPKMSLSMMPPKQ